MKRCPQCKIEKFEDEFAKNAHPRWGGDEYASWCRVCNRRRHRIRYQNKRIEVLKEKKSRWASMSIERKNKKLKQFRESSWSKRVEVITRYGGKCTCCGETEIKFLEIDHINNDGALHRKFIGSSRIVAWLKKENYPSGFQILCSNCNMAKSRHGICPHKVSAVDIRLD